MSNTIEMLDNRPWIPHHIPSAVRKELYRRTIDQGFNYVKNVNMSGYSDGSSWKNYRGPLTAWVRLTSNGTGTTKNPAAIQSTERREGFILYGGQGFYDAFGKLNFKNNTTYKSSILGYDTNGRPHYLDLGSTSECPETNPNTFTSNPQLIFGKDSRPVPLFTPSPGIVSIEASMQKERIRKVSINWKCYSFAQLEYMMPYFLTPGISMVVEFGWNLFNINSLIDIKNIPELKKLWIDGTSLYDRSILSNGLYDATFGSVVNFEFGTQDGITYDCKTEIYSKHRNYTGALLNDVSKESKIQDETVTAPTFYEFCNQRLKSIEKCLEGDGKNFFESLTDDETKKWANNNFNTTELKKSFYNGQKENRIFIGRGRVSSDPLSITKTVTQILSNLGGIGGGGGLPTKNTTYTTVSSNADKEDWDYSKPDDVWVTMDFIIELLNIFITLKTQVIDDKNKNVLLNKINIDDVVIGAHPNLISTDASKILIPNSIAPKYNLGSQYWKDPDNESHWQKNKYQAQTSLSKKNPDYVKFVPISGQEQSKIKPYDLKIYKVFKTGYGIDINSLDKSNFLKNALLEEVAKVAKLYGIDRTNPDNNNTPIEPKLQIGTFRNNLDRIINRFKYQFDPTLSPGSAAFPQLIPCPINNKKEYYWGYLKDLFVNVNVVLESAKNAKTAEEFLTSLLNVLSSASAGYWELAVIESEKDLKIIDKKFIPNSVYENLYQFDIASDSCIKSLSFNVNPSNIQMNQTIAGSTNNKGNSIGQSTSNQLPYFVYGDRLNVSELVDDEIKKTPVNTAIDLIKQLQTYGNKIGGMYNMTFGELNSNFYEIVSLALPSNNLLLSLMDCQDYEDNTNIYGGQQPNFTLELILQGISGLRTFQCFSIKNLPKPYSPEDVLFQIVDVSHTIQNGEWVTTIKAGVRPLRQAVYKYSNGHEEYNSNQIVEIKNKS